SDSVIVHLREDSTGSVFRGVGFNLERFGEVGHAEYGVRCESRLEILEGFFGSTCPFERVVLSCEVVERFGDLGVVSDESSIEVPEAKELSDLFDVFRCWPVG